MWSLALLGKFIMSIPTEILMLDSFEFIFLICSYNNEKEMLTSGILQMILGTGISMKYGSGGGSNKLSSAVCQATDKKCSVSRATPNSVSGKQ